MSRADTIFAELVADETYKTLAELKDLLSEHLIAQLFHAPAAPMEELPPKRVGVSKPPPAKAPQLRRIVLMQYQLAKGTPPADWEASALLGLFYVRYEEWCLAPYKDGTVKANLDDMEAVVEDYGPAQTHAGIEALFGQQLKWVNRKTLDFFTNERNWTRHIAPAIASSKTTRGRGEMSESKAAAGSEYQARRKK